MTSDQYNGLQVHATSQDLGARSLELEFVTMTVITLSKSQLLNPRDHASENRYKNGYSHSETP